MGDNVFSSSQMAIMLQAFWNLQDRSMAHWGNSPDYRPRECGTDAGEAIAARQYLQSHLEKLFLKRRHGRSIANDTCREFSSCTSAIPHLHLGKLAVLPRLIQCCTLPVFLRFFALHWMYRNHKSAPIFHVYRLEIHR